MLNAKVEGKLIIANIAQQVIQSMLELEKYDWQVWKRKTVTVAVQIRILTLQNYKYSRAKQQPSYNEWMK